MAKPKELWITVVVNPSVEFIIRMDAAMAAVGYLPDNAGWEYLKDAATEEGKGKIETWQQVYTLDESPVGQEGVH